MTREEARAIAAQDWLKIGERMIEWDDPSDDPLIVRMIIHERELIRRRLQRLAKPRVRSKP